MKQRHFMLLACMGLAFSAFACHEESSSSGSNGCHVGEKKCSDDGKGFISCGENLKWESTATECGDGLICDPKRKAACMPCLLQDIQCSEKKEGYLVCGEDGWGNVTLCEGGLVCSDELKRCVEVPCKQDTRRCSPNKTSIETCASGRWSSRPCDKGQFCDQGNCITPNVCTPNVDLCSGTGSDAGIYHCTDEGIVGAFVQPCPLGCNEDNSGCKVDTCTPNVDVCRGIGSEAGMYHCTQEGVVGDFVESCPQGCNNDNSACYVERCETEESVRCSPDLMESQICKDGRWTTKDFCPDTDLCDENECKKTVCRPNSEVCSGSGKGTGMYHCTPSGQIGDLIHYCDRCNADHSACLECEDGRFRCTDKGVFQGCDNGFWTDVVSCGNSDSCSDAGKVLGCLCNVGDSENNGDQSLRCNADNSAIEECVALKYAGISYVGWQKRMDCGGADMCDLFTSSKMPACKCRDEGQYICNGQMLQSCETDRLYDIEECAPQEICDAEKRKCICKEGERRCSEKMTTEVCKDGKWVEEVACKRSEKCNDKLGSICVSHAKTCSMEGQLACFANQLMTCSNGVYELDRACSNYCTVETEAGSAMCSARCTPNRPSCSPDYTSIQVCNETGDGTINKLCDPGKRCVSGSDEEATCEDKVCDEGSYRCEGSILTYCYHNQYVQLADCNTYSGMTCSAGKCVASNKL